MVKSMKVSYELDEHPINKKVFTTLWACPRQLTRTWGCPTILDRLNDFMGRKPDAYFGLTDGVSDGKGITIDIESQNKPTIVADWNYLPFRDNTFDYTFWDPPYDHRYDKGLKEILRVTNRTIAILHQLVYPNPRGWGKRAIIGITTGPNTRARVLQIYERLKTLEEYQQPYGEAKI